MLLDTVLFQFELKINVFIIGRISYLHVQTVKVGSQQARSVSVAHGQAVCLVFQYIVRGDMAESHFLIEGRTAVLRLVGDKHEYILRT